MTDLHILSDPVSDFWKCPKRGLKNYLLAFCYHIFDTFGLIGSVKTFSKVLGVSMNIAPYMAYILYIYIFFYPLYKKGVLGVTNFVVTSLQQLLAILAIKVAEFLKLEHFLRPFF